MLLDPGTKTRRGACNNVVCKECVTKLFGVESPDMLEAVRPLQNEALKMATSDSSKSRKPKLQNLFEVSKAGLSDSLFLVNATLTGETFGKSSHDLVSRQRKEHVYGS